MIDKINHFIEKNKFIKNNKIWSISNFITSILVLIFCIASIISVGGTSITMFVYFGYLVSAILNIICSCVLLTTIIINEKSNFYKKWYFYLLCLLALIEIIILPVLLNLLTKVSNLIVITSFNLSAVLWFVLIFAFAIFAIASTILLYSFLTNDKTNIIANSDNHINNNLPNEVQNSLNETNNNSSENDSDQSFKSAFDKLFANDDENNNKIEEKNNENEVVNPDYIIDNDGHIKE